MFRHVALFRWSAEATDEDRDSVAQGLDGLPAAVPTIRAFRHGRDAALSDDNFDYAVVADFDDAEGYLVYRDHPVHQDVLVTRVRPILGQRAAVQYETG